MSDLDHYRPLVQESFEKVLPIADQVADLFYGRLLHLDPSLTPLFPSDMVEQKMKLVATLKVAVNGLNKPEALVPVLRDLGAKHLGYGVEDSHYEIGGDALIWTLSQGLGDAFTDEVKAAWLFVYGFVADEMKAGAAVAAGAV